MNIVRCLFIFVLLFCLPIVFIGNSSSVKRLLKVCPTSENETIVFDNSIHSIVNEVRICLFFKYIVDGDNFILVCLTKVCYTTSSNVVHIHVTYLQEYIM